VSHLTNGFSTIRLESLFKVVSLPLILVFYFMCSHFVSENHSNGPCPLLTECTKQSHSRESESRCENTSEDSRKPGRDRTLVLPDVKFLGAFLKLRKVTINILMSVRPSVLMEQFGCHLSNFDEI
jgi:hypothetical protein